MEGFIQIVLGLLLVAHGLVHLMWFVPNDDPAWPFSLDRSWLPSEASRRTVGTALIALVVAAFALLGPAVWGVPGLVSIWPALTIVGAVASAAILVIFWNRQLVLGVVIDVALVVVALWQPGWTDRFG